MNTNEPSPTTTPSIDWVSINEGIREGLSVILRILLDFFLSPLGIVIIIALVFLAILPKIIKKKKTTWQSIAPTNNTPSPTPLPSPLNISRKHFPYKLKYSLLTKREIDFHKILKPIAEKHNLAVAIKPRIADFIEVTVNQYQRKSGFWSYFNKIAAKHVDFLLCDPVSFEPKFAVELDDSTHDSSHDRRYRDAYVDEVYAASGLIALHIRNYNAEYLDKMIADNLGLTHPEPLTCADADTSARKQTHTV